MVSIEVFGRTAKPDIMLQDVKAILKSYDGIRAGNVFFADSVDPSL